MKGVVLRGWKYREGREEVRMKLMKKGRAWRRREGWRKREG